MVSTILTKACIINVWSDSIERATCAIKLITKTILTLEKALLAIYRNSVIK